MWKDSKSKRILSYPPVGLAAALLGIVCGTAAWGQAVTGFSGQAYGTRVSVSPGSSDVGSGPTAVSVLCTEKTGISDTNSVSNVSLPPIAITGVVDTSVASAVVSGGTAATATANVAGLSLLGGLITADAVKSVSSSISGSTGFSTSAAGTTFTNASVLGIPVLIHVAPNTRIALPGIGFVILNEQQPQVTLTGASLTVNSIHVHVTQTNILGLQVGTQLIVAHAQSNTLVNVGLLQGFGYGSSVTAAGVLNAGRSAAVTLPCVAQGEVTNSVVSVILPGVLSTGTVHSTAQGSVTPTGTSGQVTASVEGLSLLSGLVGATTITADASVSTNGSAVTLSDSGSLFVGLAVTGHPEIGGNPAPNTRVSLTGLGTLWLHRVIQTSTAIEVRMVELVVDAPNTLGLPVGADIRVAVAHVGVVN
jgi:hypothetical protein